MKSIYCSVFFSLVSLFCFGQNFSTLEIGQKCPMLDSKMLSTNKQFYELKKQFNGNGLLVVFTSNKCPFVVMWEDRYKMLEKLCFQNDVRMVYVNSNANKRNQEDSFEAMQKHALKMDYRFPYVIDKNSMLANAFGAKTTPHVFLFNSNKDLVYKGAIDDNYEKPDQVKSFYLKDAIKSTVAGKKVKISETRAVGCSIKRFNP